MATLFNCSFENGKLYDPPPWGVGPEFTAQSGGSLEVLGAAAHDGNYGLKVTPVSNSTRYAAVGFFNPTSLALKKFRQRFWLHPNSISIASGNTFRIHRNYYYSYNMTTYVIWLGYDGGGYFVQTGIYNGDLDDTNYSNSGLIHITNAWHRIETYFQAGTSGSLTIWVDGTEGDTLTCNNADACISSPAIGILYPATTGFTVSGSFYLDSWKANDDGSEIGA